MSPGLKPSRSAAEPESTWVIFAISVGSILESYDVRVGVGKQDFVGDWFTGRALDSPLRITDLVTVNAAARHSRCSRARLGNGRRGAGYSLGVLNRDGFTCLPIKYGLMVTVVSVHVRRLDHRLSETLQRDVV